MDNPPNVGVCQAAKVVSFNPARTYLPGDVEDHSVILDDGSDRPLCPTGPTGPTGPFDYPGTTGATGVAVWEDPPAPPSKEDEYFKHFEQYPWPEF